MDNSRQPLEIKDRDHAVRMSIILTVALICGVLVFATVVIALVHLQKMPAVGFEGILIGVGAIFAAVCLVASSIVPQMMPIPNPPSEHTLMQAFLGRNLIQKAMIEGATFLNLIAYLIEQSVWSLAIVAALLAAMLMSFPSRTKLDHFIESHMGY